MSTSPTSRKDDARIRVRSRFRQFLRFESIRTATSLYQLLEDIAAEKYPDRPWEQGFEEDHHYGVARFKGRKGERDVESKGQGKKK